MYKTASAASNFRNRSVGQPHTLSPNLTLPNYPIELANAKGGPSRAQTKYLLNRNAQNSNYESILMNANDGTMLGNGLVSSRKQGSSMRLSQDNKGSQFPALKQ